MRVSADVINGESTPEREVLDKVLCEGNIDFFQSADVQNSNANVAHAIEAAADARAAAGAREATGRIPAELAAAEASCRTAQTSAAYTVAHYRRGCSTASITSMCRLRTSFDLYDRDQIARAKYSNRITR